MFYKIAFTLVSLFLVQLHAESLHNKITATPCKTPAVANDDLNKKFRYGCFCGKDYPTIEQLSKKSYRHLNQTERKEVIYQYQQIEPYDDIDKACQEHDICYIAHGKRAKVCNDTIYTTLNEIEEKFDSMNENNVTHDQCKNLAFDIRSVFGTIFAPADDEDTIFDFGMLMFNTGITVANKTLQESADTISDNPPRYPSAKEKCLVESLNKKSNFVKSAEKVTVITIKR